MTPADSTAALKSALAAVSPDTWREQRWFAAKDRGVREASLVDVAWLEPGFGVAIVCVEFEGHGELDVSDAQIYQLPVALEQPSLFASADSEALWRRVFEAFAETRTITGERGEFRFARTDSTSAADWPAFETSRDLGADQSNSSQIINESFLLKLFRRLQFAEHPNPELEVSTELLGYGFAHAPIIRGALEHESSDGLVTLAVVQDFLPDPVDGWRYALDLLAEEGPGAHWLDFCRSLGVVTASLHRALAAPSDSKEFDAVVMSSNDVADLRAEIRSEASALEFPEIEELAKDSSLERDPESLGQRIRVHGDYHLGQIVLSGGEIFIVDFEGEPAQPLDERRRRHSPLKDVAGMLRSFDYAVATAMADGQLKPTGDLDATSFRRDVAEASERVYVEAYMADAGESEALLPAGDARDSLLELFKIQKALYELRYELQNRPAMVDVPRSYLVERLRSMS